MARRSNTKVYRVRGADELVAKLKSVTDLERRAASRALTTVARLTQSNARRLAPRRTGKLAASIAVGATEEEMRDRSAAVVHSRRGFVPAGSDLPAILDATGKGLRVYIGTALPYAFAVEFGRRPHTIAPADARALRFIGTRGEQYAAAVQHPGQQKTLFMYNSGELARRPLQHEIRQELRGAFREIAE